MPTSGSARLSTPQRQLPRAHRVRTLLDLVGHERSNNPFVEVSLQEFQDVLMPVPEPPSYQPRCSAKMFENLEPGMNHSDIAAEFTRVVNGARLCSGYKLVLSPNEYGTDETAMRNVHAADLFLRTDVPKDGSPDVYDRCMHIEFEMKTPRPFKKRAFRIRKGFPSAPTLPVEAPRSEHVQEVLSRSDRTHMFTVLVGGIFFSAMCWDKAGTVVVSRKTNYRNEPKALRNFLWRFSMLSDEQQGRDPTAQEYVVPAYSG